MSENDDNNDLDQDGERTQIFQEAPSGKRPNAKEFPQLYCRRGAGLEGRTLPLLAPLLFGRSPDCDVVLEDPNISRKHANFKVEGDRVSVEDLKSANHVYVNDAKVDESDLSDGDVVNIGKTFEFIFIASLGAEKNEDSATRVVSWDDEGEEDKTRVLTPEGAPKKADAKKKPNLLRVVLIAAILALLLFAGLSIVKGRRGETPAPSVERAAQVSSDPGAPRPAGPVVVEEGSAVAPEAGKVAVSAVTGEGREEPQAVAAAGSTATPAPSSTPAPTHTPTEVFPTPTPTTNISEAMVKEKALSSWLSAVASGEVEALRAVYLDEKVPKYWPPVVALKVHPGEAKVSKGSREGEFEVTVQLNPEEGQPVEVSLHWKVKLVDGKLLIREETLDRKALQEVVLLPCRQALQRGDMDGTFGALAAMRDLLAGEGMAERLGWEPENMANWERELDNCRKLMDQADRSLAEGDLEAAEGKTRNLSQAAGALESPIVEKGDTNWFLRRAQEIRKALQTRRIEAVPTQDPAIAREAGALIEKAGLEKELGNLEESKRLYREARDLLPENHSLLRRIPPWAMRD
jgi:pSer/pThr/pTyr-binding forkhead associated (FHA) protein